MDSFKTSFARTKQKLMTKTGHSDETIDVQYHYEKEKILAVEERLIRIQKNAKKINDLMKDLNKTMTDISSDTCDLYEATDKLFVPGTQIKEVASGYETHRKAYEDRTSESFNKPLAEYIAQYKEVKKRMEELTTRKVDMDRYKNELGKLREKATSSNSKNRLGPTEEKFKICKEGYESLHAELVRDLPILYEDKNPYFRFLLAALIKSQEDLYRAMASEWAHLPAMVSHINDTAGKDHPNVITPVNHSSASINIRDDPAFKSNASIKTKTTPEYTTTSGPLAKDIKDVRKPGEQPQIQTVTSPNPAYQYASAGQKKATAVYDFTALDSTELSFKAGDQITVFSCEGEWWEGEVHGVRGLVPANYVTLD
ncbi:SH3 domain-containing protein [Heterostelium album PN500]|uniref:SH3 domain-containing protein n=1 Tax=Heterostelium pallidum (strain ATCC 26659 / Pp 5 / PN500) TaxID=670386 RepID=D3BME2_HETP5|nr:SH3 domain-containing protein [Heterostelium album PN500]EFA77154.1 SH3 domain-containing protein [Heterostelium album PN500]|eukprot:XP_020429283.1 SH3 domain-containing protein [Heterostelium album PN500]